MEYGNELVGRGWRGPHFFQQRTQQAGCEAQGTAPAWFRMVRRVGAGDAARNDQELTGLINRLCSDANWAFFRPKRTALRDQFYARLNGHLSKRPAWLNVGRPIPGTLNPYALRFTRDG